MRREMIKGGLIGIAFMIMVCIAGTVDANVYRGIHYREGYISNSGVLTLESGEAYETSGFIPGYVKVKLDGHGNILSIKSKEA